MTIYRFKLLIVFALLATSLGFDWHTRFPNASTEEILHWGSYKSQRIHAVTEKTDPLDSLTLSLMYASDLSSQENLNLKFNVLDVQPPSEEENKVYYKYHNGFYYAEQLVEDTQNSVNMTNTFFKTTVRSDRQAWRSLTTLNSKNDSSEDYTTLFYGIALESYAATSERYLEIDPTNNQINILSPNNPMTPTGDISTSYINYYIYEDGKPIEDGVEIYYRSVSGLNASTLWKLVEHTNDTLELTEGYLNVGRTIDPDAESTYLVLLQFKVPANNSYSVLITYDSAYPVVPAPNWEKMQVSLTTFEAEYLVAFDLTFKNIDDDHKQLARYALSNLIGGIIYYYGPIEITEDPTPQPALSLFTATPTRNSFQRGFLWDEGFHELLICNWNPNLCLEIISSWLHTEYKTGWIPREQARGDEILSFVPGAFASQSNLEGNPPTLMLTIQYFLLNPSVDISLKNRLYTDLKDSLYQWWSWFYNLQQVTDDSGKGTNLFLWSYKVLEGNIQYFGSGLDDYPRDDPGFVSKYHLDLQVWQILFADVMVQISKGAQDVANTTFFSNLTQTLKDKLPLFVDPSDNLYKDVFKENGSNSSNSTNVPSSHVGYISLMPLMFGYIEDGSAAFNATLDLVDNNLTTGGYGVLFSDYGIVSLAVNDSKFEKNSDYWTGPIWINFNYLLLRGFKLYYWNNPRVQRLYSSIREAVLATMNDNFVRSGYIWEHYNLTTGLGEGNHPFTGWSTVVNFILTEQY